MCKTFREMSITEGMHMFQITISVITGTTMASWIQKKSQMINRHRDYVSLLLHFHGYIPFLSVCLSVCVCVSVFLSVFASVCQTERQTKTEGQNDRDRQTKTDPDRPRQMGKTQIYTQMDR